MLNNYIEGSSIMSFAYPMKKILYDTLGITFEQGEYAKNNGRIKAFLKFFNPLFLFLDVRKALQIFGTEGMKPWFGNSVWRDVLEKHIHADTIIISDWRFPEEYDWGDDYEVITVRVYRDKLKSTDSHISENALSDFKVDYVMPNHFSLSNLENKVGHLASNILKKSK